MIDAPASSVIVPVRNAREHVGEQLDALAAQVTGRDIECIVIDDASTDGTTDAIRAWIDRTKSSAQFRLIARAARGGPNASRNAGLRQARGDFLLFADGDDVVAPGWIDAFTSLRNPRALFCGRVVNMVNRTDDGGSRALPGDFAPPHWGGWAFAYGGCMAGPRWMFERVGGFDENILLGGTETEFAIRAQREIGIDVVGVPAAILWHRLPITGTGWFRKYFARERGYAYIRRRYRGEVHRPSVRIGVAKVASAVAGLATADASGRAAFALLARGAGGCMGSLWWGCAFRLRMPPPRLFDDLDAVSSSRRAAEPVVPA